MKRDGEPSLEQPIVDQVYRQREAASLFGVSVSTWKRYVVAGLVPPPVQIGPGRVGWLHSDLVATQEAWRRQRGGVAYNGEASADSVRGRSAEGCRFRD